jgi:hypothetical protein
MQMNRLFLAGVGLLALAACSGFPFFGTRGPQKNRCSSERSSLVQKSYASSRATLELHDVRYDGEYLVGRLLISPVDGPLLLDKRIISTVDVDVDSVRECSTGERVKHVVMDILPPRMCEEDVLVLEPGYWYGGEVRFPLFAEEFTGLGPECIEVGLSLLSFDRKFVGHVFARATRTLHQSMDGGTLGDGVPAMDAGASEADGGLRP